MVYYRGQAAGVKGQERLASCLFTPEPIYTWPRPRAAEDSMEEARAKGRGDDEKMQWNQRTAATERTSIHQLEDSRRNTDC
ncbi:unnamed protein product [Boreogadus saida]